MKLQTKEKNLQEISEKQALYSTLAELNKGQEKIFTAVERISSSLQSLNGAVKSLSKIMDDNISAQKEIADNLQNYGLEFFVFFF